MDRSQIKDCLAHHNLPSGEGEKKGEQVELGESNAESSSQPLYSHDTPDQTHSDSSGAIHHEPVQPLPLGSSPATDPNKNTQNAEAEGTSTAAETSPQDSKYNGVTLVRKWKKDNGEFAEEQKSLTSLEQLSAGFSEKSTWLTITETVESESSKGSEDNTRITIADEGVLDFIRNELKSYIEHMGKKSWDARSVTLPTAFNPLILNWRHVLKAYAGMNLEKDGITFTRVGILIDVLKRICPSMVKIQEEWDSCPEIEWKDIEVLFVQGSLIVANWHEPGSPGIDKAPQVFKVNDVPVSMIPDEFLFTAWIWDSDGAQKLPVRTMYTFSIRNYRDRQRIEQLPFYPVDFFKYDGKRGLDAVRSHPEYQKRRTLFQQFALRQTGPPMTLKYKGEVHNLQANVDDAAELMESLMLFGPYAPWSTKPSTSTQSASGFRWVHVNGDIVIDMKNYIQKGGGHRFLGNRQPNVFTADCSCSLCNDDLTKKWRDSIATEQLSPAEDINDLLLAPRVFGFTLGRKIWCQLALDKITTEEVETDEISSKDFILPEGVEKDDLTDIAHMVKAHTQVMSQNSDHRIGDAIGGKGESLVFLFHGHSGTGKTLLAEILARHSGKPLYKVGTSDIGLEVTKAERKLKEIFELAEAWDALLLIDEADVLLDARGTTNEGGLDKNSLVSVLLREVEYYKGVLIMTTNRIVAFDPAILSRIHYAVNFTQLTVDQQRKLWEIWVNKLNARGLCQNVDEIREWVESLKSKRTGGGYPLNGREIRNIVIVAQTMAFKDGQQGKVTKRYLQTAYNTKVDFRRDTEKLRMAAEALLATKQQNAG